MQFCYAIYYLRSLCTFIKIHRFNNVSLVIINKTIIIILLSMLLISSLHGFMFCLQAPNEDQNIRCTISLRLHRLS